MFDLDWIRISTTMCEDEKLKLINAMPERDTIFYIWIRLLQQAGKTNDDGYIYLNESTGYTKKMLSVIFDRPVKSINQALKALTKLNLITIEENNFIKIVSWEKNQNVEGIERIKEQTKKRVAKHREKKKKEEQEKNIQENSCNEIIDLNDEEGNVTQDVKEEIDNKDSNVTENKSNVTVTQEKERENKTKNKIKNNNQIEKEREDKNIKENHVVELTENLSDKADEIIKYYEHATGKEGWLESGAIKIALLGHAEQYVRLAIDKAIQGNKLNVKYIIGILRNWRNEGYPGDSQVSSNNKTLNFNNFKAREYNYDELEWKLLGW